MYNQRNFVFVYRFLSNFESILADDLFFSKDEKIEMSRTVVQRLKEMMDELVEVDEDEDEDDDDDVLDI